MKHGLGPRPCCGHDDGRRARKRRLLRRRQLRREGQQHRGRPEFGTVAYADACDRGRPFASAMVVVGRSAVCPGVGIFATRDLPAGTVVTRYAGLWRRTTPDVRCTRSASKIRSDHQRAAYLYEAADGAWEVDGMPPHQRPGTRRGPRLGDTRGGLAQLANDAIHPEVTGRRNNCAFHEVAAAAGGSKAAGGKSQTRHPELYLRTMRDVQAGEELLVPYTLWYWMPRMHDPGLPEALRAWLQCHAHIADQLNARCCRSVITCNPRKAVVRIEDYHGVECFSDQKEGVATGCAHYELMFRADVVAAECGCSAQRRYKQWVCMDADVWLQGPGAAATTDDGTPSSPTVQFVRCRRCTRVLLLDPSCLNAGAT